jgi:ATPase subunit of ABC transporter with duplicated ATPase domains
VLDEPTNHLDLGNIATLEHWLTEVIKLPMLIVSHDREFLNRVTTRTLFLRADGAHSFKTSFSAARQALLERDAHEARRRALEEKEIKRLEQVCARYKVWAQKNDEFDKRRKIVERRIERLEGAKTQVYVARERRLELAEGDIDAKVALRVDDYAVAAPDGRKLFTIDRLAIRAGDRVALLGVNGAGKSTLLSVLAGAFAANSGAHYDGKARVRFNPGSRLAVFDQSMSDLPLGDSPVEYMAAVDGVTEREAIQGLVKAGFAFKRIEMPIGVFSVGERARLMFLRLKAERPNFYLLDEPTNHLDIEGQEALESELEDADVSCMFVSHDRYFTRSAATRFLEIRRGRLVEVDDPDEFFAAQAA